MGNAPSRKLVLDDGTDVGDSSDQGKAYAKAIERMHCILKGCDDEFMAVSDTANANGRASAEFKAAAQRLAACQQRRHDEFSTIESICGPAQGAFKLCVQDAAKGREHECLPVLHAFLDCSERALHDKSSSGRASDCCKTGR